MCFVVLQTTAPYLKHPCGTERKRRLLRVDQAPRVLRCPPRGHTLSSRTINEPLVFGLSQLSLSSISHQMSSEQPCCYLLTRSSCSANIKTLLTLCHITYHSRQSGRLTQTPQPAGTAGSEGSRYTPWALWACKRPFDHTPTTASPL